MTLSCFQTVFKARPNRNRVWVILMVLVFSIPTIVNAGYGIVGFMFYRLQYKISTEVYGHLISAWFVINFFSQMVVLPFLSKTLGFRDTTIMILGLAPAILGFVAEAFFTQVWVLFVLWTVFYLLYFNIFTTTRSAMSKIIDPTEIGKAYSVLGVLEKCLGLIAKPIYGMLYKFSLHFFAGLFILISAGIMAVALTIAIFLHFGMKRSQNRNDETVQE